MAKQITLQLGPIKIDEAELEAFKKQNGEDTYLYKLASWAGYFLNHYLRGGVMLTATDLDNIQKSTDTTITSPEDVMAAVQSAKGRKRGMHTVEVELDPVWWPAAEEVAKWQECKVDDLVNEMVNTCVGNNWLFDWQPPETIPVGREELAEIKKLVGAGHVSGGVLVNALRKAVQK